MALLCGLRRDRFRRGGRPMWPGRDVMAGRRRRVVRTQGRRPPVVASRVLGSSGGRQVLTLWSYFGNAPAIVSETVRHGGRSRPCRFSGLAFVELDFAHRRGRLPFACRWSAKPGWIEERHYPWTSSSPAAVSPQPRKRAAFRAASCGKAQERSTERKRSGRAASGTDFCQHEPG